MLAGGAAAALAGPLRPAEADPLVVETESGKLRGTVADGLRLFKGIPYGQAERFRPPGPAARWTGIREALHYGPPCPQINGDAGAWKDPATAGEDCLVLNVWAPQGARGAPVMVWIHGGAFETGSGGLAIYDGGTLARTGQVVVVTLNHRLNLFGYWHLATLADRFAGASNLGQLDLVRALAWIKANIAGFGGDPGNVTLFGESGGGGKISVLMAMPAAQGLFHKAIIESGAMPRCRTRDEAAATAQYMMRALEATTVPQLLDMPPERLLKAYEAVLPSQASLDFDQLLFAPYVDGTILPAQPEESLAL